MKTALFSLLFFVFLCSNTFADTEKPTLQKLQHYGSKIEVGTTFVVYGSNFGTDTKQLKVSVNGKDFSVKESSGNMLQFVVDKSMTSGKIFIKKTVSIQGKKTTLESEALDIDVQEPKITKIEAGNGIAPKAEIKVTGKNLEDSAFFCDKTQIETLKDSDTEVILKLPESFLSCDLELQLRGFSIATKIPLLSYPEVVLYDAKLNGTEIIVTGKGFSYYKDKLSSLKFHIGSNTFTPKKYNSDTEIILTLSKNIQEIGNMILEVEKQFSSPLFYNFNIEMPVVTEVGTPTFSNGVFTFEIKTNAMLQKNSFEVYMNETKLSGNFVGTSFFTSVKTPPKEKSEFYIVSGKVAGERFIAENLLSFSPEIYSVTAINTLNKNYGKLKITGKNFSEVFKTKVSSSAKEISIEKSSDSELIVSYANTEKEGIFTLKVSNSFGSSESVNFPIPSESLTNFYPIPSVEEILFFTKNKKTWMRIRGKNIKSVGKIQIEKNFFAPQNQNNSETEFILSSNISEKGSFIVFSKNNIASKAISYIKTITNINETKITLENPSGIIVKNSELQNIVNMNIQPKLEKTFSGEIHISCKNCSNTIPFSTLHFFDENNKEISGVHTEFVPNEKHIFFSNLQTSGNISIKADTVKTTGDFNLSFINIRVSDGTNTKTLSDKLENTFTIHTGNESLFCYTQTEKGFEKCTPQIIKTNTGKAHVKDTETTQTESLKTSSPLRFKDVKNSDWFVPYLEKLMSLGIIQGFSDQTFRPAASITRAELLKMILVSKNETWNSYATATFSDTKDHWSKDMLEYAVEKGYIKAAKKFEPMKEVSRAETAGMLCKIFPAILVTNAEHPFTDIRGRSDENCIANLYEKKIVQDNTSHAFSPDAKVTRAEFIKMLSLVLEAV